MFVPDLLCRSYNREDRKYEIYNSVTVNQRHIIMFKNLKIYVF